MKSDAEIGRAVRANLFSQAVASREGCDEVRRGIRTVLEEHPELRMLKRGVARRVNAVLPTELRRSTRRIQELLKETRN
jgi:hypothetical protein